MKLGKTKLQELKDKKVSIGDLNDRYFINSQYKIETDNILKLLNENVCSFKEIVCRSINLDIYNGCLYKLLENKKLFEELIQNNRLTKDDLRYLLSRIAIDYELWRLCYNTPLTKYLLNEFVLNKKVVDRLNRMVEEIDWCKRKNIHTLFDLIKYSHKNDKEILKLNELNEKVHSFDLTKNQKLEISKVLRNNEIAQNILKDIVDNNLESNYDFESLMSCLKKIEKKNLFSI